jgi:hypothetical protein
MWATLALAAVMRQKHISGCCGASLESGNFMCYAETTHQEGSGRIFGTPHFIPAYNASMRKLSLSLLVLAVAISGRAQSSGFARPVVPCEIVVPALNANHVVLTATAPDGRAYPVFHVAPPSELVAHVKRGLETSYAQQVLRMDRYARDLVAAKRVKAGLSDEAWLHAPMYLLISGEEGGFARFGFWLEDDARKRQLILAGYVDLVITDDSVNTGDFEEIFSHELGHLILKALAGAPEAGQSRKMHQSMTVTDYPTAFDEGFAEHFQPLVRDATTNSYLSKLNSGTGASDLELFWLSAADGQLRTDGVKRNLFIHLKPLPEIAFGDSPDLYRMFVSSETSTAFLPTELKNGQQMLASEGVIATLFYRMVNDEQLRNHYREALFYQPFLHDGSIRPEKIITPYENANLKLFAAMAELGGTDRNRPVMVRLIECYARLFPDEAKRIETIFIETTWGATVSQELASRMEHAAGEGGRGDINAFRQDRPFHLLDSTVAEVVDGKLRLDANVGPEIWLLNPEFKIARAMWETDRTLPLTINLNTATEPELMTIPGIDLATAQKIIAARRARGYFQNVGDLGSVLAPDIMRRLNSMSDAMKQMQAYRRE